MIAPRCGRADFRERLVCLCADGLRDTLARGVVRTLADRVWCLAARACDLPADLRGPRTAAREAGTARGRETDRLAWRPARLDFTRETAERERVWAGLLTDRLCAPLAVFTRDLAERGGRAQESSAGNANTVIRTPAVNATRYIATVLTVHLLSNVH